MNLHNELFEKVRNYRIPVSAVQLLSAHPPLIVTGVTASGKTSVLKQIETTSDYRHVVTHTTRPPRGDEISGQNYWFVDEAGMLKLMESEALVEVKAVHGETLYGPTVSSYQSVLDGGH